MPPLSATNAADPAMPIGSFPTIAQQDATEPAPTIEASPAIETSPAVEASHVTEAAPAIETSSPIEASPAVEASTVVEASPVATQPAEPASHDAASTADCGGPERSSPKDGAAPPGSRGALPGKGKELCTPHLISLAFLACSAQSRSRG